MVVDADVVAWWAVSALLWAVGVWRQPAAVERDGATTLTIPSSDLAQALLRRWHERATRWRTAAVVPSVTCAIVAGVLLRQSVVVGVGAHPAWSDPVLAGMLGALGGAVGAELHHLRPRPRGLRVAGLVPREPGAMRPDRSRTRQLVVATLALGTTALAAAVPRGGLPLSGLLALLVAAGLPVAQQVIALRPRPAVSADLQQADQSLRRLAIHSIDHTGAGLVLLLSAWQLGSLGRLSVVGDGPLGPLVVAAQLAGLVVAFAWWRRSHPDRLLSAHQVQASEPST